MRISGPLGGLVLAGLLAYLIFHPGLPVPRPLTVRGVDQPRPVTAAIADFKPDQIVTVLPRDAIAALDDPRLVPAARARLRPHDLVIGVEIADEARAYAVKVLSAHEIVNEAIRGHPYAVTW